MAKVSIILPVFNGERYLDEAITSIRNQTYDNWELIVVNDGSIDQSGEIVRRHCNADSRIRYTEHKRNLGLVSSLNDGLKLATGDFIARQDADDLSSPERIEKMVGWLTKNLSVAMIGSNGYYIDEAGTITRQSDFPADHNLILDGVFNDETPFFHGSWVFRRICLEQVGYYNPLLFSGEDKDYLIRVAEQYKISTHPERLYFYRFHRDAFTSGPKCRRKLMRRLVLNLGQERRVKGKDSIGLAIGKYLNEENIPENIRTSLSHLLNSAGWMDKKNMAKATVYLLRAFTSGFGNSLTVRLCYFLVTLEMRVIWRKVTLKGSRIT